MLFVNSVCNLNLLGGDLFVHAKSDSNSKLFELAQEFLRKLPKDSVKSFEDFYGFVYKDGRDLSGFIDGSLFVEM